MTERLYRLIQGLYLFFALYFEQDMMIYVFVAMLAFEAITNIRIPMIIAKIQYGSANVADPVNPNFIYKLESERLLRIVVMLFLIVSYILYPESIWFFPWFVAAMLFLAGITNICPMVMLFQSLGFR